MRALSIRQPHAEAIMRGVKRPDSSCENTDSRQELGGTILTCAESLRLLDLDLLEEREIELFLLEAFT